jgi:hypothetical protein
MVRDWIAEAIADRLIHPCQKLTLKGEKSYREKVTEKRQGRNEMERVRRVELPTLCLASIRSSQLSYTRTDKFFT